MYFFVEFKLILVFNIHWRAKLTLYSNYTSFLLKEDKYIFLFFDEPIIPINETFEVEEEEWKKRRNDQTLKK